MRTYNHKLNIWGRRVLILLLLCGILLSMGQMAHAASVTYTYEWTKDKSGLPKDNQWHDYFIAWEDLDDKSKVWFTDYHWYTAGGDSNIDEGGTHWMEYKAASTLPNNTAGSFTSKESLGHMQIKYAGVDEDNDNSPMYYIRVSKMTGQYSYFTRYEPTNTESSADAFTFLDKGDVFHIFVNISGKADRFLTRDGQYLETTESSSYGGGEHYRPLRVYRRTFTVDQTEQGDGGDIIGKVTLYEYSWVNTVDEMLALAANKDWTNVLLAWEDSDGDTEDRNKVWYTKEIWYNQKGNPNYENCAGNNWYYYSNDYLGSDGYGSPQGERFLLPSQVSHFQVKRVGWDDDNPINGYKKADGKQQDSPVFQFRFDIGRGRYVYIGNNAFYDDAKDVEDYTVQLRLGKTRKEDLYGSVWIINNMFGEDEVFTRYENYFGISNWNSCGYWELPFRLYTYEPVEYEAIVKSFTIGKGTTYSIDKSLIVDEGVTITVENGGLLTVDDHLLNNGRIVVKNGGTVIVNEGGYIMAYDAKAEGEISLDGGNLIIMDGAKVICDQNGGTLEAVNGSTVLNRGFLMVGSKLALNHNSILKNETDAMMLVGGRIVQERGGIGALSFADIVHRVKNEGYTAIYSNHSLFINKGTVNQPGSTTVTSTVDTENGAQVIDSGMIALR